MRFSEAFPILSRWPVPSVGAHLFRFEGGEDIPLVNLTESPPMRLPFGAETHWAEADLGRHRYGIRFQEKTWKELIDSGYMGYDPSLGDPPDWYYDAEDRDRALLVEVFFATSAPGFAIGTCLIPLDRDTGGLIPLDRDTVGLIPPGSSSGIRSIIFLSPGVTKEIRNSMAVDYPTAKEAATILVGAGLRCLVYNLSLINCKNVELETHRTTSKPSKKSRRRRPEVEYHTIKLPAPRGGGGGGATQNPGSGKYHLVRGHFKTYTEEHKLFGKHTGTYWWPWAARGSKENGEVVSTYDVTPRKEA